jgi:hypothetical protein
MQLDILVAAHLAHLSEYLSDLSDHHPVLVGQATSLVLIRDKDRGCENCECILIRV